MLFSVNHFGFKVDIRCIYLIVVAAWSALRFAPQIAASDFTMFSMGQSHHAVSSRVSIVVSSNLRRKTLAGLPVTML